ncbi:MAG: hypothetical protein ABIJ96_07090 [Elusimicrobiota bacterium]
MSKDAILLRRWLAPALLLGYFVFLFTGLHAVPRGLIERDGYFHARYAQMLPQRGLSRKFPWTQASPWKHRFADKEFLFHVLLSPFARGAEPIRGALVFSVLLSAGVFAAFYFFLAANGARAPGLFTFFLACMGGPFLLRMSFLRAHVLSVVLLLIGLHFLLRGRWKELFGLGFVYAWSYSFPFVLPLLALPYLAGKRLAGGKFEWKCLAAAAGGVLAGLVIHPYTPYSLDSAATYFDILGIAAGRRSFAAVEVGREFAPYSTRSFLLSFPMLTMVLGGLGLAGWATKRKLSAESMGLLCAAGAAALTTMIYMRAIEYAAPLTAAALAFALRDTLDKPAIDRLKDLLKRKPRRIWIVATLVAALLGAAHIQGLVYSYGMSARSEPPRFKQAAVWMAANMIEGETMVNLWWDDFPDLFYHGHRQTYVVGLDPAYLLRHNRQTALRLEGMRLGRLPLDAEWLAETFAARYMVLRTAYARFYPQLMTREWRPVYRDEYAAVYALKGPAGPPAHLRGLPQIPALR